MKKSICGMIALLCSVAYGCDSSEKGDDSCKKIVVSDSTGQGSYKESFISQEEKQARFAEQKIEVETLWKKIPVQNSSLRGCDAMPTTIPFDAVFKGITYKFEMTQYHDREYGEMSDIADFEVSLGKHHVGTFYSLSKSEVFKIIHAENDKKSFSAPVSSKPLSETKKINWEYFGIERCSLLKCMGRPY